MSSKDPNMGGGGGMGWPGMATKQQNPTTQGGRRRRLACLIRARPAAVDREIFPARSPRRAPPPWPARVSRGWPKTSPTAKPCLA